MIVIDLPARVCLGYSCNMENPRERIAKLTAQIAELKARWPAHSVQPWLVQQLEDLEEEIEQLRSETQPEIKQEQNHE